MNVYKPNFITVDTYDNKPNLKDGQSCILLDVSNDDLNPNKVYHWFALIKEKGIIYIYDSFGKISSVFNNKDIMKKGWKKTNLNIEQGLLEENCGSRCCSFLMCCYKYGASEVAKVI